MSVIKEIIRRYRDYKVAQVIADYLRNGDVSGAKDYLAGNYVGKEDNYFSLCDSMISLIK